MTKERMTVLHVVAGLDPAQGGPSRTVTYLVDALSDQPSMKLTLLTQKQDGKATVRSRSAAVDRRECSSSSRFAMRVGLPLKKELDRLGESKRPSVIHSHGVWLPVNHWAAKAAHRSGVPLVVQPRGMLEPWAMRHREWKKNFAMALYQRNDLKKASMIVATSYEEYQHIDALGFGIPIAIIPNGVDLPAVSFPERRANASPRIRTALFLSRIHKKKGLVNLLHAWSRIRPVGWRLHIVGPDEGGHLNEVIREAEDLGIEHLIDWTGEVDDLEKARVYQKADLFVLPTFSENFGVVVAEALSYALPVITTRGAPWSDLHAHCCGWWIDIGVEPLVAALAEAINMTDTARAAMGFRGREYAKRYNWSEIARETVGVYRWLLGRAERPTCVRIG